jgi:hypothetical protein
MTNAVHPGEQGVTHELSAYREPANGDYVAYLDMLERRQLGQMVSAQAASNTAHAGKAPVGKPATAEIDALMGRIESAKSRFGRWGTAQVVAAVIGAVLVLMTLVGEGSFVTLLIGIGLLWAPATRLLRVLRELDPRTHRALIDKRFGKSNKA